MPATSAKVTLPLASVCSLALLLPNCMALLLEPCIWFSMNMKKRPSATMKKRLGSSTSSQSLVLGFSETVVFANFSGFFFTSSMSPAALE